MIEQSTVCPSLLWKALKEAFHTLATCLMATGYIIEFKKTIHWFFGRYFSYYLSLLLWPHLLAIMNRSPKGSSLLGREAISGKQLFQELSWWWKALEAKMKHPQPFQGPFKVKTERVLILPIWDSIQIVALGISARHVCTRGWWWN